MRNGSKKLIVGIFLPLVLFSSNFTTTGIDLDQSSIFKIDFEFDYELQDYPNIYFNYDPTQDAFLAEKTSEVVNSGEFSMKIDATVTSGASGVFFNLDLPFSEFDHISFYMIAMMPDYSTFRVTLIDTYGNPLSIDYTQKFNGWETGPIYDLSTAIIQNQWNFHSRSLEADIGVALQYSGGPYTSFSPQRISHLEIFQPGHGNRILDYFDDIVFSNFMVSEESPSDTYGNTNTTGNDQLDANTTQGPVLDLPFLKLTQTVVFLSVVILVDRRSKKYSTS